MTWTNKVFIDYSQSAESHVPGIVVLIEGERVIGVEPPMIKMPALVGFANCDQGDLSPFLAPAFTGADEDRYQLVQALRVFFIESARLRAVEIQDAE